MSDFQDHLTESLADPIFARAFLVNALAETGCCKYTWEEILALIKRIHTIHTQETK